MPKLDTKIIFNAGLGVVLAQAVLVPAYLLIRKTIGL